MKSDLWKINEIVAWSGMLLGFLSGMALGMFFHREDWLGGYGSLRRRMYRLAHISLFGLGAVNLLFYLTARTFDPGALLAAASSLFILGSVTMPLCCLLMAHFPKTHLAFGIPVLSLIAAGTLTLMEVIKQ
ncbi:MAG: hypothetical protein ACLQVY_16945 [Limisphaerales bacterium]